MEESKIEEIEKAETESEPTKIYGPEMKRIVEGYEKERLQLRPTTQAELQAAVKLAPGDASYRLMLATLYRDLGFWRRAISELERALSIDPKNIEAKRMLQSLEAKK